MWLLLLYLLLALLISFLCSIVETILLSTPLPFLLTKVEEGKRGALLFAKQKREIDSSLSAILTINTIAHTIGAAGVGAQATELFGSAYFGLISAILTLIILFFSEILPKTIGAYYWKGLYSFSAYVIAGMTYIVYPFVMVAEFMTSLISRKAKSSASVSREEFATMVDIGLKEGVIEPTEGKIIQNIIKLKSIKVAQVMTPRVVVARASEEMTIEQFHSNSAFRRFSRIPLYSAENEEEITGFVHRQDVIENMANDQFDLKLSSIKKPIIFVPETQPLTVLWEKLLKEKGHIALVVDEYGGFEGVVTLEDVIETILGLEIIDERDIAADMQQYAKERWEQKKQPN